MTPTFLTSLLLLAAIMTVTRRTDYVLARTSYSVRQENDVSDKAMTARTDKYSEWFAPASTTAAPATKVVDEPAKAAATRTEADFKRKSLDLKRESDRMASIRSFDSFKLEDGFMDVENVKTPPYNPNHRLSYQRINVRIDIAATEFASVYLNGFLVGNVQDWRSYEIFDCFAGVGDVISIIALNLQGFHGIIANILLDDKEYMTGIPGMFTAMPADQVEAKDKFAWKMRGNKFCKWNEPAVMDRPSSERFSHLFPYKKGAKYVWARSAPIIGHVYLRFVIGGDKCDSSNNEQEPVIVEEQGIKECPCKEVDNSITSDCYEFSDEKSYAFFGVKKSCTRRDCYPTYECVEKGDESSTICLRRYATREIVKVKGNGGKCKQFYIHPPKPYYAPYASV